LLGGWLDGAVWEEADEWYKKLEEDKAANATSSTTTEEQAK
jgi:hypothetical protein